MDHVPSVAGILEGRMGRSRRLGGAKGGPARKKFFSSFEMV